MRVGMSKQGDRFKIFWSLLLIVFFLLSIWCAVRMHAVYINTACAYANNVAERAISDSVYSVFGGEIGEMTSVTENERAMLFKTDTAQINLINSKLLSLLQEEVSKINYKTVYIPLGTITGIAVFSGLGPKIPVIIHPVSVVNTDFSETFDSCGINQVRHSIWIDVDIKMAYSGYMFKSDKNVSVSVPITNTVIVGDVPEYYGSDAMEMVR